MRARLLGCGLFAATLLAAGTPSARAADTGLDAYDVPATAANLEELRREGFDVGEARTGDRQEIVATSAQARKLRARGIRAELKRDAAGRSSRQEAERARKPDGSYDVFRPYFDATFVGKNPDGTPRDTIYEELVRFAEENPNLVRAQEIGRTANGKPIIALRVTKDVSQTPVRARPSVLFMATQHAREWIVPENLRRQIRYFVENYGRVDAVTELVNTRELWFVPVANPDGYDFTFTRGNRLWRKNLRELNGVPGTQPGDGVDPNRNFPASWGLDDEGSSPNPRSETYRGPGPASEPETQAIDRLFAQQDFAMLVNYHSAAELLLYGKSPYVEGTTPDDPIYRALSGTDTDPAIKGKAPEVPNAYDPDVSSELYTTNGDTDEYTYTRYEALSWTPEMDVADRSRGAVGEEGRAPSVFEFQDSEGDLQAAFEKNLPFAIDVARSADDPADPESHLGNTVADFEPKTFAVSYGAPQPVATLAKRKLGPVTVRWSINGGEEQSAPTQEFQGGERFGGGGAHFHEVRGVVTGAKPGDTVRVRFLAGGRTSSSFRYDQASDSDAPVLLLAAENQKGTSAYPALPAGGALAFDQPYAEALTATGVAFDTWDVDARGGAPDALGVLGHYKAVVWYTGNDLLTRSPGQPGGTGTAKFGNDVTLAVRSFMNEGGKLLYTGQNAAFAATSGVYGYNPQGEPPYCDSPNPLGDYTAPFNRCVLVSDDFLQYWVGAFRHTKAAGSTGPGDLAQDKAAVTARPLRLAAPFGTQPFTLNGGTSKDNQAHLSTALTTQSVVGERFKAQVFATFEGPGVLSPGDSGLVTGPGIATADSVYLAFGFEGITEASQRRAVMDAALKHLGVLAPSAPPPGDGGVGTPGGGGGAGGSGTPPRGTLPKPPTGRPRSPVPAFTLGAFRVNRAGSVPVTVRCRVAAGAAGCTGTVSLRSGRSVLGSTRYTLRAGQRRAIIVRVRRATLRTLLRRGRLRVDVRVSNTSGRARSTVITVRRATLKAPARTR